MQSETHPTRRVLRTNPATADQAAPIDHRRRTGDDPKPPDRLPGSRACLCDPRSLCSLRRTFRRGCKVRCHNGSCEENVSPGRRCRCGAWALRYPKAIVSSIAQHNTAFRLTTGSGMAPDRESGSRVSAFGMKVGNRWHCYTFDASGDQGFRMLDNARSAWAWATSQVRASGSGCNVSGYDFTRCPYQRHDRKRRGAKPWDTCTLRNAYRRYLSGDYAGDLPRRLDRLRRFQRWQDRRREERARQAAYNHMISHMLSLTT